MKGSPLVGDLVGRSVPSNFHWHRHIAAVLTQASDSLATWLERNRQRGDLMALSDDVLHDIGLSRFEAERESRKWFWQG